MVELKAKVILNKKGDEAYVSLKQLMVSLKWTAAVDLDLVAFYKSKDGRVGGVFSNNYVGGDMGNLNSFPYIQLSDDAGVGATGGENEEILRITKLEEMAEIYICALNYTDASLNNPQSFHNYDAHVLLIDDTGESIAVPLDSQTLGTVAIIAKIDNTGFLGAKLVKENQVMDLATFQQLIPGANSLNIESKIILKRKGDSVQLKRKVEEILVNLNWHQGEAKRGLLGLFTGDNGAIDLDLGCLFELTDGEKGAVQALGNSFGAWEYPPFILLSGDDRTGASSEGENLLINAKHISEFKRILIYAFIYEGIANWSQADGVVTIQQQGAPDIVVNLDEPRDRLAMCAIALFENKGNSFTVEKVVEYFPSHPEMDKAFNWGLRWTPGTK